MFYIDITKSFRYQSNFLQPFLHLIKATLYPNQAQPDRQSNVFKLATLNQKDLYLLLPEHIALLKRELLWPFLGNIPTADICKAATWSTPFIYQTLLCGCFSTPTSQSRSSSATYSFSNYCNSQRLATSFQKGLLYSLCRACVSTATHAIERIMLHTLQASVRGMQCCNQSKKHFISKKLILIEIYPQFIKKRQ